MKLILAAATLALAGCASVVTNDIDRAIGLATTAGDEQGLHCLQAHKVIFSVEQIGVFTIMEQARLMLRTAAECGGMVPTR